MEAASLREEEPVDKGWSGVVRRNRTTGESDNGMSGQCPAGGVAVLISHEEM